MTKVTLDREAFKALASDTRLEILRTLDGRKMSLTEISRATNLNKATLHEHLNKLLEADLVKRKDREGHKWVYYKLSWKGESLLHPENTKIVVMFSAAFVTLAAAVIQMFLYAKGTVQTAFNTFSTEDGMLVTNSLDTNESIPAMLNNTTKTFGGERGIDLLGQGNENTHLLYQDPLFLYAAVVCFTIFIIVLAVAIWRLWVNKTPKL
jgi:DNA-binding transcriptional ArsR family regulator